LQSADVELTKDQLEKEGLSLEGRGGNVPVVEVSAKKAQGLQELLETITLLAEVTGLPNLPMAGLEAVVIETNKSKAGNLVSVVVKKGTLKVGEEVVAGGNWAKIRGIFDSFGKQVKQVLPGYPAQVLGFDSLPAVGSLVTTKVSDNLKKDRLEQVNKVIKDKMKEGQIPILIKAESTGALNALKTNIPDKIFVVDATVGDVNEGDVLLAKSSGAKIFTFNTKANSSIKKYASTEGVVIEQFNIIYKLFERLEEIVKGAEIKILAKAQIIAEFPFNKKKVAGCKILEGVISKKSQLFLTRGDKQLGKVKILSIKKEKEEVDEAGQSQECGILFVPQLDFRIGDMLVSVEKK
jgi:translation initiation factor IF-2